ncbi:MAG: transposase, partial [Desulfuromonas sp.]
KPRIHIPGAVYHVVLRSVDNQPLFADDEDYRYFCQLMHEGVERFDHRIHAFCLIPDHAHIAVQIGDISLSRVMQNLSFRYTRWFNNRHERKGPLFRGRYKAILVDGAAYLLELVRYIHLNPMRNGLVHVPIDYNWSSHRAYCGKQELLWLTTDHVLSQFDPHERIAMNRFQRFMVDGLSEKERDDLQRGGLVDRRVLGDEQFVAEALEAPVVKVGGAAEVRAVVDVVMEHYGITLWALKAPGKARLAAEARAVAALSVLEGGYGTLTELGRLVARDLTTLSSAVSRLKTRLGGNGKLAEIVNRLWGFVELICRSGRRDPVHKDHSTGRGVKK